MLGLTAQVDPRAHNKNTHGFITKDPYSRMSILNIRLFAELVNLTFV